MVAGSAATAATAALAACGAPASPPGDSGKSGGAATPVASVPDREVVIAVSRDLANGPQDPFFTHSSPMVWEPLVGLDNALKPLPVLAEKWDLSDDAKTWTFKLRPGVKFSDGTP